MIISDFTLIEIQKWTKVSLLKLKCEEKLPKIFPGQFVQVRIDQSPSTYLRRPISIHNVIPDNDEIWLLVQRVGKGTEWLCQLTVGTKVNIVLPLGKPFTLPELRCSCQAQPSDYLLVGGGVGIAPLLYLGKLLQAQYNIRPKFLLGGRSKNDLVQLDSFHSYGDLYVTTEDGSLGEKGFVTNHSVLKQISGNKDLQVCCCGPKPMMMAVAKWAREAHLNCEVSLENMMACGLGACLCCVEKTTEGHLCVCKDGPVFNINQLLW